MTDAVRIALVTGAAFLLVGSLVGFASWMRVSLRLQLAGIIAVGLAAGLSFVSDVTVGSSFTSALTPALGLDPLSGFFLMVLALAGAPALLYAEGWIDDSRHGRALCGLTGLFVLALVAVVCARDVVTFLAAWELMTVLPAASIVAYRRDSQALRAAFVYLSMTHLAGAGVWIALLVLADQGAVGAAGQLAASTQALVLVAALIGFGTKAGVMPLHSWLPRAHPAAPAHVSAVMSGVMIKVALYGLIRVAGWFDSVPTWFGLTLLAVGVLSSVGGVTYALFQHNLKRLLAFHSIENVGIIALGLAASYLFASAGNERWAAIALSAALLHTLNHALFKSLLFLGAGTFERITGSVGLDHLGGLLRRSPVTGWSFLVGAAAIAGVVPLNGFVSEWLTFQSLIHGVSDVRGGVGLAMALAVAGLAMTAALALLCFVKVIGLTLLGPTRAGDDAAGRDAAPSMKLAVALLAVQCIALGLVPAIVLSPLLRMTGAHADSVWPAVSIPGASLPALAVACAIAVLALLLMRMRGHSARSTATWACGQQLDPTLLWTSAGFTKALRLMVAPALRPTREVTTEGQPGLVASVEYHGHVPHLFDTALLQPASSAAAVVVAHGRKLQSGSLPAYVASLAGVVAIVVALVRLDVLG